MTQTTNTVLWNDSCSIRELSISVEKNGAVGAICNSTIVLKVLKSEMQNWPERIPAMIVGAPEATEDKVATRVVEEVSKGAAALLEPDFHRSQGRNGRLSMHTDPRL
jgi:transaldolase